MTSRVRVWTLSLAFVVAGCVGRTVGSVPSEAPTMSPTESATATPRALIRGNDLLYVRQTAGGGQKLAIAVLDARSGEIARTLPDGVLSPDRRTLYASELIDGGTRTLVRAMDLASGRELRTFTVAGDFSSVWAPEEIGGMSADGRLLALRGFPVQRDGKWNSTYAVLEAATGTDRGRIHLEALATYGLVALRDDRLAVLTEAGNGANTMRAYDLVSGELLTAQAFSGWDGRQQGYRTPFARSADGRWIFTLETGGADIEGSRGPYVLALDLVARRAVKIALPAEQRSVDFEKYLLWTLVLTPDGSVLYASNAALGVVNEIDAKALTLRRTQRISKAQGPDSVLAHVRQALFPVADAKRYIRSGALLSPDARTLYTVGDKGVAVIDTATLQQKSLWLDDVAIDALALSPDGAHLYALDGPGRSIVVLDASMRSDRCALGQAAGVKNPACGGILGAIPLQGHVESILRIDLR